MVIAENDFEKAYENLLLNSKQVLKFNPDHQNGQNTHFLETFMNPKSIIFYGSFCMDSKPS